MLKKHTQIFVSVLRIMDMSLVFGAWEIAYQLRFNWLNHPHVSIIPSHDEYLKAALFVTVLTGLVFSFSGVYRLHKVILPSRELFHLLRATFSLILLTLVAAFFYREFSFSRIHSIYFITCLIILLFFSRLLTRSTLNWLHTTGKHVENVLLIGSGVSAKKFLEHLENLKSLGIILIGVVETGSNSNSEIPSDIPRIGRIDQLNQTIQENQIDQVFITLSSEDHNILPQLKKTLAEQWVDVSIIPDLGTFRTMHTEIESFDGIPVVTLVQSPMTGWNKVLKRILDICGSFCAIVIFAPAMILITLLVRLTSSGPAIYGQERMGLDGRIFRALKFRSMRLDAESQTGAVWASENDERRTKFGIFLRKYSLDELPQLFNVFKGEMSLVGPRPERPIFIEKFKSQIPHYMLRHKVKAGITGWAQINGWRGNTSLEKRIECDLYYIERWTIWLDLKILFLTLFRGFINPNAY